MREYGEGIGLGIWILCLRALGRPLGPSITGTYIYWLWVQKKVRSALSLRFCGRI